MFLYAESITMTEDSDLINRGGRNIADTYADKTEHSRKVRYGGKSSIVDDMLRSDAVNYIIIYRCCHGKDHHGNGGNYSAEFEKRSREQLYIFGTSFNK